MSYLILIASVLIGVLIVFALKPSPKITQLLVAFSGTYLLSITVLHLIPETFKTQNKNIGFFVLLGLLLQLTLDFFSKGAEHGHIHIKNQNNFPWALFISLCVHAFLEGVPILEHGHSHNEHLLWAIVVHKVPIAIVLATFFIHSKFTKVKAIVFLVLFSLMSPLGSFVGNHFTQLVQYRTELSALIIGIFLHISTVIIFESSKDHSFNLRKFIAILIGMLVAVLL